MNMFTAMLAMMALLTWSSSHAQTLVIARDWVGARYSGTGRELHG